MLASLQLVVVVGSLALAQDYTSNTISQDYSGLDTGPAGDYGDISDPYDIPILQVQYSTVQYSTVQYSTVQYSTVQYNTVHVMTSPPAGARHRGEDREN